MNTRARRPMWCMAGEGHEVPAGELMTMNDAGEFICVKCADEIKAQTKNKLQRKVRLQNESTSIYPCSGGMLHGGGFGERGRSHDQGRYGLAESRRDGHGRFRPDKIYAGPASGRGAGETEKQGAAICSWRLHGPAWRYGRNVGDCRRGRQEIRNLWRAEDQDVHDLLFPFPRRDPGGGCGDCPIGVIDAVVYLQKANRGHPTNRYRGGFRLPTITDL